MKRKSLDINLIMTHQHDESFDIDHRIIIEFTTGVTPKEAKKLFYDMVQAARDVANNSKIVKDTTGCS